MKQSNVLIFTAIYLPFHFLIIIWYSTDFEVHLVHLSHFYKNQSKFDESQGYIFQDLQFQNVLTMLLFCVKHSHLLTPKITPGVNNPL